MSDTVRRMAGPGALFPRRAEPPDGGRGAAQPAAAGPVHLMVRLLAEHEPCASRRVVHLAPLPARDGVPAVLVAYCGTVIERGTAELLTTLAGVPCTRCLLRC
jgi:hypothetical protein